MRVIANSQPEVALRCLAWNDDGVFAGAEKLHDREREIRKAIRIGGATLAEKGVQRARVRCVGQRLACLASNVDDPAPPLRCLQDPPQRRRPALGEKPARFAVGGDHEILDEVLGAVLLLAAKIRDLIAVEYGMALRPFKTTP